MWQRAGKSEAGFSLIELMVAMTLSLLTVGGSLATYKVQQRSFERQGTIGEVEQNVRFGFDMIVQDIRAAGFLTNQDVDLVLLTPGNDNAVGGDQIVDTTDSITVRYAIGNQVATNFLPAIDSATVRVTSLDLDGDQRDDLSEADIDPGNAATWVPVILSLGYNGGEAESAMVTSVADLGVGGPYQVTLVKVDNDEGNDGALDRNNYGTGISYLALLQEVTYFITDGADLPNEAAPSEPQLVRQINSGVPELIAEGITDLQFSYSVSGSSTVGVDMLDDVAAQNLIEGNVTAVRIAMLGRSVNPDVHGKYYELTYGGLVGVRNAL